MLAPLLAPALLTATLLTLLTPPAPLTSWTPPTSPASPRSLPPDARARPGMTTGAVFSTTQRRPAGSWLPPVGGLPVAVVHPFSAPPAPYAAGHRGVDLRAAAGDLVRAPTAGRVVFAGQVAGRPLVVLLHPGGLRTTYEPVAPSVSVGDQVAGGQPVGTLAAAASHCLPRACLHWGARVGSGGSERYVDPLALLARHGPVRLLPLDGNRRGG